MKSNAPYRLRASAGGSIVLARGPEVSEWWHHLPAPEKKEYIEEHPNSKYADQAIKEGEAQDHASSPGLEPGSKQRKSWASSFKGARSKIAGEVKRTFPLMTHAASAMKSLATGKALDHHQKEVLYELGHVVLKAGITHAVGNVQAGAAIHKIGVTAVNHAISHFKDAKAKNPKSDDLETFVDSVADGIENAKEAPVPADHARPGSSYRKAIAKAFKSAASHTVQVLEKSFSNVKPAVQGLGALARGTPLDEKQKHALKHIGKYALATTIATLPGGIAAHLIAGAGAAAVGHALKAVRGQEASGRELLEKFVQSIGEGLEHAAIHHAAGGEHGGHEGHGGGDHGLGFSDVGEQGLGLTDTKDFGEHGSGHGQQQPKSNKGHQ